MKKKHLLIGLATAAGIGVAIAAVVKIVSDKRNKMDEDEFDDLFGLDDDMFDDGMEEKFEKAFDDQRKIREEADKQSHNTSCDSSNIPANKSDTVEVYANSQETSDTENNAVSQD